MTQDTTHSGARCACAGCASGAPVDFYVASFDGEAVRLHGEVFAVGAVLLCRSGSVVERFYARCEPDGPMGEWTQEHVLPVLPGGVTHPTPRDMRDAFWRWLQAAMKRQDGDTMVVVDCGWPVEMNLLSACAGDAPSRERTGPYPLHEAATFLSAAGFDPLGTYGPVLVPGATPHNPVDDAHVSALCFREAMVIARVLPLAQPGLLQLKAVVSSPLARGRSSSDVAFATDVAAAIVRGASMLTDAELDELGAAGAGWSELWSEALDEAWEMPDRPAKRAT